MTLIYTKMRFDSVADLATSLLPKRSMVAPWNEFFTRNCNSIAAAVCSHVR